MMVFPNADKNTYRCWLVRPFYPNHNNEHGRDPFKNHMPDWCKTLKRVASFKKGDLVQFKKSLNDKVKMDTNWIISTIESRPNCNANLILREAHQALSVPDPDNPKNSLKANFVTLPLNDFMKALNYESSHRSSDKS